MIAVSRILHLLLFATYSGDVSGAAYVDPLRIVIVPVVGGVIIGLIGLVLSRKRRTAIVDPVEANALHGGRRSIRDSLVLIVQTLISNGFGRPDGR